MDRKRLLRNPLLWIMAVLLLWLGLSALFDDTRGYEQVPTSTALEQITSGNVREAVLEDREQQLRLTLENPLNGNTQLISQFPAQATDDFTQALIDADIPEDWDTTVTQDSLLFQVLIYLIPLGLLLLLLMWMMNSSQGGGNRVMNFGKSKAKQLNKDMPQTSFSDVAGAQEAVDELYEIKDFLQAPGRYQALGAKIPKGVLLYGPPGTGKTLLARAVAGEAGVPFYSISGSDFVEMFVGVGASRVRDLFEQAKQNAPCIIFVDEIDAVGRQRGAGLGGGHDEREQTLNQLLVEMDGFDSRGGIILIAATNRPDILDPALLRPGRFDRQIPVAAPDMAGRKAILKVHSKGKPFDSDVDLDSLAKRTVGMSGADLANVINEAALLTARQNGQLINGASLEESVDRVVGGPARRSRVVSEKEKKLVAYHEGGHALAAWAMPDLEPVYKLTILPRGRTGGHALVVPEDDKELMTRSEMIGRLVFALGGRSAEELVFHEPTTGASSDIDQATKIARAMVTEYGMSARLGAVKYGKDEGDPFLGRSMGSQPNYSLEAAHEIDKEVRALIEAAHTEAWEILRTYRDVLDDLVRELLEKETLQRRDLERIFAGVTKRPRITAFNDFGGRTPSDKPPIMSPAELAKERGEPWPPLVEEAPSPVGSAPGGGDLPGHPPGAHPGNRPPGEDGDRDGLPPHDPGPRGPHPAEPEKDPGPVQYPVPSAAGAQEMNHNGNGVGSGPPHYGAPPGWTPATSPSGPPSSWTPSWERQTGPSWERRDETGSTTGPDGTERISREDLNNSSPPPEGDENRGDGGGR
ncbi:cell division protease FtsH [Actinoalloteichus hoggarensis]|uniref:ATP-dependent zinc metalloprotease FtsH n=1 Tax=Actinoalloteichus hoggarensis TaxID=1470176 RepID=A0A221VWT7_9PSEU|nr:ATP-dependent zinc metalloprotease FtsH [Actinoalloteichus hoggarensis]ASO17973.1 ATP-dependent zinc metalloprotease FtsH [Actinoalloteichus hoggarensis]MBB5924385.1 cell division protease FtsH [Actinoalloteichus hoggarensis]